MKRSMWKNPRPILTVELMSGAQLGNCYHGTTYRITSTKPLSAEDIGLIRKAGFIGHGQEFYIKGQLLEGGEKILINSVPKTLDWKESRDIEPSGTELVEAKVYDELTGKLLPEQAVNEYTKKPLEPIWMPYYRYLTEDRVDSGD